jgi:hypothetical protein
MPRWRACWQRTRPWTWCLCATKEQEGDIRIQTGMVFDILDCKLTTVGQWELQSWLEELTDVRPLDVLLLLDLSNTEDLSYTKNTHHQSSRPN